MKTFATRHPLVFSSLLALALLGLTFVSQAALPTYVAPSVENLPADLVREPTEGEAALSALTTSENLFQLTAALLAVILLTGLGWWREAGFNRPAHIRSPHLLLFPLFVCALPFLGGVQLPEPALLLIPALLSLLVAAFAEEALYRGIFWRALAPKGIMLATLITSLLSATLFLVRSLSVAIGPETIYLSVLTLCAGFAYAALRWRTASIWPPTLLHLALGVSAELSTPERVPNLGTPLVLASTLGFVGYALLLLRGR